MPDERREIQLKRPASHTCSRRFDFYTTPGGGSARGEVTKVVQRSSDYDPSLAQRRRSFRIDIVSSRAGEAWQKRLSEPRVVRRNKGSFDYAAQDDTGLKRLC